MKPGVAASFATNKYNMKLTSKRVLSIPNEISASSVDIFFATSRNEAI